jgi:hypothetical protein
MTKADELRFPFRLKALFGLDPVTDAVAEYKYWLSVLGTRGWGEDGRCTYIHTWISATLTESSVGITPFSYRIVGKG